MTMEFDRRDEKFIKDIGSLVELIPLDREMEIKNLLLVNNRYQNIRKDEKKILEKNRVLAVRRTETRSK